MRTECRNVFTFIFTTCQGCPPLELFIILRAALLYSASRNDLSLSPPPNPSLSLSLCRADLLSKQNIKQNSSAALSIAGRQIFVASMSQLTPGPLPPSKLPFAVEGCSTFFLFVTFSPCVLQGKPLRWFVSQAHETLFSTVKHLISRSCSLSFLLSLPLLLDLGWETKIFPIFWKKSYQTEE